MDALLGMLPNYCELNRPFKKWSIPWLELKKALELVERNDIIELLLEQTLLTKGKF